MRGGLLFQARRLLSTAVARVFGTFFGLTLTLLLAAAAIARIIWISLAIATLIAVNTEALLLDKSIGRPGVELQVGSEGDRAFKSVFV